MVSLTLDPRVKLTGALALIVACVASRRLTVLVGLSVIRLLTGASFARAIENDE